VSGEKPHALTNSISVRFNDRQHDALRAHCNAMDVPVGTWLRVIACNQIPPEHWKPVKPPPGQLTLEDA